MIETAHTFSGRSLFTDDPISIVDHRSERRLSPCSNHKLGKLRVLECWCCISGNWLIALDVWRRANVSSRFANWSVFSLELPWLSTVKKPKCGESTMLRKLPAICQRPKSPKKPRDLDFLEPINAMRRGGGLCRCTLIQMISATWRLNPFC